MATFDQMIIDDRDLANRYFGDSNLDNLDDDQYLFSKPTTTNQEPFTLHSDDPNETANTNLFGRRVFLESPSLGNKEDEDLYRYVPSRLSDHTTAVLGPVPPAPTGDTLIDSLDFELDLLGATNTRHAIPYRTNTQTFDASKPPASLTQLTNPLTPMTNMRRADPRQDPLIGPLLAELDAMSTQQQRLMQAQPPAPPIPAYRRNSVPYEQNYSRPPPAQSQANNALTTTNSRTGNNNLLNNDLYDSLEPREQQRQQIPSSAPNINQSHQPQFQQQQQQQHPQPHPQLPNRRSNMNSTDIFMPLSYNDGPTSFLSNFGTDDQLFQQPLFNAIGQNYVSNPRQPPPPVPQQQSQFDQRNTTFDQSYARMSPPPRSNYPPPNTNTNNNNNNNPQQQQQPFSNRQPAYNNDNDPFSEYHDMYGPSQYSRAPPSQPEQQRMIPQPPASQPQQRRPQPPSSQQNQYQRPPSSSQYDRPNYNQDPYNSNYESNNQEMFFTDHNDDQLDPFSDPQHLPPISQRNNDQNMDQDSRRQAVWNELQRTNAKVQEKNAKKRESVNRREQLLKGNYGSNNNWPSTNSQHSSAQAKVDSRPQVPRRPPPIPVPKTNYIDENIDMIKNKENFYHRYPAKKYENLYSKRKDLAGEGNSDKKREPTQNTHTEFEQAQTTSYNNPTTTHSDAQHRSSLPVTINLNQENNSQRGGNLPGSITIPLDSQVTREGDKISVNIDLRLVDLQHLKQQQQRDHPDWSSLDPLDRHIRKLEQSLDQSLPQTYSPTQQRSPTFSNPSMNASVGRYGKTTTGAARGGYSPPNYRSEQYQYNYSDKGQEENSYLAKMNHVKKGPHFKPYTGQDYEQFKKNYGFGTGYLGFDFDNPNYKEKSDKLAKTKEYAQQIEMRNKKKLSEAPRRTLSDTRIPTEASKTQRALEYARVSTRHKPQSGPTTRPFPSDMNGNPQQGRRPTEVVNRPPAIQKQPTRLAQHDDNELVERLALRHERDKAQVQGILNPSQKRRDQLFNDDDRRGSDIERLAQERANQRRYSPPRQGPPSGQTNNGNARRPLRFDKPLVADESSYTPPHPQNSQHYRPAQQHDRQVTPPPRQRSQHYDDQQSQQHSHTRVDELASRHNDEKMLMEAIRQELSERPLGNDEELIVVEQ